MDLKGIALTLDALIAMLLVVSVISLLVFFRTESISPFFESQQLHALSEDVLTILSESTLKEVVSEDLINQYLANGVLNENDLNKKAIDVIGALWAAGNVSEAANISKDILNDLLPDNIGYQVLINNDNVYNSSDTNRPSYEDATTEISSARVASGYEKYKPVTGYVARAWATKIKKNTTEVFSFSPEGAGNRGGKLEIWKKFFINASEIINATFYISIHRGRSDEDLEQLKVNGNQIASPQINWLWVEELTGFGAGIFGVVDVTDKIQPGWNEIYIRVKNSVYNAHIHEGMRLEITYSSNESLKVQEIVKKRFYFDKIISNDEGNRRSGVWAVQPFYIPKDAEIRNVTLHLRVTNLTSRCPQNYDSVCNCYGICGSSAYYDIKIFFGDKTLYQAKAPYNNYLFDMTFNLTPNATEGTNVISAYFNVYGDTFWGVGDKTLFSDFETDDSSYIDVEYKLPERRLRYGYIDVGINELLGGNKENPKSYRINFEGAELWETFLHVAKLFSDITTITVNNTTVVKQIFKSPASRATPSDIFIDPSYFSLFLNNTIRMSDNGYSNDFLPQSSFEYKVLVPSQVGYGNVNETLEGAIEDAKRRLNETLGKYVTATGVETDYSSVSNVPYMWGPAGIRIRLWS